MTELGLGPLALPLAPLVTGIALVLALLTGKRIAARQGASVENLLWTIFAAALLAARIAFVARYWPYYAEAPWHILDLRDGGFKPAAGIAAAAALAAWLAWRPYQPPGRGDRLAGPADHAVLRCRRVGGHGGAGDRGLAALSGVPIWAACELSCAASPSPWP